LYLESQRRLVDGETEYYLNRARYTLATKNVHFVKGTLLDYDGIFLAEGPWPGEAYHDAAKREASRSRPVPLNYASSRAPVVSHGPFDQLPAQELPIEAVNVDPFSDENSHLGPPTNEMPLNEPALQPANEPLPPPTDEAEPEPVSAALPSLVQPTSIEAAGNNQRAPSGVIVTSGQNNASGGVVPAIQLGPKPSVDASAESADSSTTKRLPPAVTR